MNREVLRMAAICGVAVAAAVLAPGCDGGLDDKACLDLRGQAFEIINEPHTCNNDAECTGSAWPGCPKPVSDKNKARIGQLKDKFDKGKCQDEKQECRETPEIYCKEGLCVTREKAGAVNPAPK